MKKHVNKIANKLGYEIHRYIPRDSHSARIQRLFSHYQIDLVLDVGANAGDYAEFLRNLGYAGKIISYEPLSDAHERLLKQSQNDDLWEVAPRTAIGDSDGDIEIHISHNSFSSSILEVEESIVKVAPDTATIGTEIVRLSRLDTLLGNEFDWLNQSVYMKVDVQGYEQQVLQGADGILQGIKGIQLELSLVRNYKGQALYKEMIDLMSGLGYELHAVIPGFTDSNTGRMLQMDGIFFRA